MSEHSIIAKPNAIFSFNRKTWTTELSMREALVLSEVKKAIDGHRELGGTLTRNLIAFPSTASGLTKIGAKRPDILKVIYDNPDCLLHYLLSDYERLAPVCEERLLGNGMGEYVFQLLHWSNATRRKLRKPVSYYTAFLSRDPYWAMQANLILKDPEFEREVASTAFLERNESAPAAFYYLVSRPTEPLTPAFQALFDEDPFYTVLGLHVLAERNFSARGLNPEKLTPRWAYHLLMFDARVHKFSAEACVLKSPTWTAEYIMKKDLCEQKPAEVRHLYIECVKNAENSVFTEFLHLWFQQIVATHPLVKAS